MLFIAHVTVDFEMKTPTVAKSSLMVSHVAVGLTVTMILTSAAAQPCNLYGHPFLGHIYVCPKGLPACDHPLDCGAWNPKGSGKVAVAVPFLKVPNDGILEVHGQ